MWNTGIGRVALALILTWSTPTTMVRLAAHASHQNPPTQAPRPNDTTARMRGRVLAADTGKPVAGATVTLVETRASNPAEPQGRWIRTDADGRWEVPDLRPGAYTLSVSKAGYLKIEYGQKRPFERGKSLAVAAGQLLDRIDIALPRGGAITGRVFDEFGDPAAAVFVRGLRQRYVDGRRELTPLAEALEASPMVEETSPTTSVSSGSMGCRQVITTCQRRSIPRERRQPRSVIHRSTIRARPRLLKPAESASGWVKRLRTST